MSKKRFFQKGSLHIVYVLIMSAVLVLFVYFLINCLLDAEWTSFAFFLIGSMILIGAIISRSYMHITVDDEKIFACGELIAPFERVQYKTEIMYNEICDLEIIYGGHNSRGEYLLRQYKMFVKFYTYSGEKLICISNYNDLQRKEFLDIVTQNTGIDKNYTFLINEFRTTGGKQVFNERKIKILNGLAEDDCSPKTIDQIGCCFPASHIIYPKFDLFATMEKLKKEGLVEETADGSKTYYALTQKGIEEQIRLNTPQDVDETEN